MRDRERETDRQREYSEGRQREYSERQTVVTIIPEGYCIKCEIV